jgi:hypothetical protein
MSKKIFIALTAFAFIAIASANSAEARHHHWWQKAWHSASHAVSHEAHVVAHGAEHAAKEVAKGAKAAANYVKANAHRACLKGMPMVIKSVVGKACKAGCGNGWFGFRSVHCLWFDPLRDLFTRRG